MKSILAAAAVSLFALGAAQAGPLTGVAGGVDVSSALVTVKHGSPHTGGPRFRGRGRTEVITTAPSGIDANTLLLLSLGGGLGATGGGLTSILPLLLAQPQQTTVVERRGRR